MRSFKYISDPKAFEVIADETRRKMVYLLRAKEQTVSQLAESLSLTTQAVYHQIRKLLDSGLVEVAREERVDHFIETYYRASAEVFEFRHGESGGGEKVKEVGEALEALKAVGLNFKVDPKALGQISKTLAHGAGLTQETEEKISQLPDVGFLARQAAYEVARLVTMSDAQFEKSMNDTREARRLLVSSLETKEKKPQHS